MGPLVTDPIAPVASDPEMEASASASDTERRLDRAIPLYAATGFSPTRIAAQLVRSGYPLDSVRRRFPEVNPQELPTPQLTRAQQREQRVLARTSHAAPLIARELAALAPAQIQSVVHALAKLRSAQPALPIPPSSKEEGEEKGVSFQYVPLIQCSFPHADPGEQSSFTRRNGWLELTISSTRAGTGLPFGVPARLLTIYCASEAIRTRSPEVFLGSSVHDFLRRLDVPISRGDRGSLRVYANQLLRLVHCAISIDENIRDEAGRSGLHIRQALFVEEARLWWDEAHGVGQGSSLVLSPVLFDSILERSAPLSTRAIRGLRKSPMDLDVYAWLVHRLFNLSRPSSVSWSQLSGQFGHSYTELRAFRRFFGDSLKRVLRVYPEAKVKCSEAGLLLLPSRPHIERRSGSAP